MTGPRWRHAAALVLFVAALGNASKSASGALSAEDDRAIRRTIEAYRTAWLANDAEGVLATFTDDAILLPAHGSPAIAGISAIKKYWFTPGGPPTTITKLNITVDETRGDGTLAFARGLDEVA